MRTSYVCVPGQCSHVGGMQRKGGEEEIAHRGWCCEDGREVGKYPLGFSRFPSGFKGIVKEVDMTSTSMPKS